MKVLIIEDEPLAAIGLEKKIKNIIPDVEIVAKLGSVNESIAFLNQNPAIDLAFLDVQLSDGLSFEIFENVVADFPVIFTTAYDEYSLRAFKLNSIDYLLKPIDDDQLEFAMRKYQRNFKPEGVSSKVMSLLKNLGKTYKSRFVIKIGDKFRVVETSEILYFYSESKVNFLRTDSGIEYPIDFSLEQLETMLDPGVFFKLNRKYIVSDRSITDMRMWSNSRIKVKIKGCDDDDIIISRERTPLFKDWLDS